MTFDRRGEPVELAVALSGAVGSDLGFGPPELGRVRRAGDRIEASATLDLRRAANREVYDQFVRAMAPARAGRQLPAALVALAAQLRRGARLDLMRYATTSSSYGADAELSAGARFGGAVELAHQRSQLVEAWTRPAGGVWEARTDCLGGATAT